MAQDQQQQQMLTPMQALWPAPPPFYKSFTKQNTTELRRLRKEAGIPSSGPSTDSQPNGDQSNDSENKDLDILSLPPELRYLTPPQPPADGTYTTFGLSSSLEPPDPSLADRDIEQLYPDSADVLKNPQPHLIALARSLLTKYLHILGVLSNNPGDYEEGTRDMETIVANLHDLVNRYRPHQARETLILIMEERVERLREEVRGIEEGARKAKELVEWFEGDEGRMGQEVRAAGDGGAAVVERKDDRARDGVKQRQRSAWAALDREMGQD